MIVFGILEIAMAWRHSCSRMSGSDCSLYPAKRSILIDVSLSLIGSEGEYLSSSFFLLPWHLRGCK